MDGAFPISGALAKLKHKPPVFGPAWNDRFFVIEVRRGKSGPEWFFSYYPSQSKSSSIRDACDAVPLHLISHVAPLASSPRLALYLAPTSTMDERTRSQLRSHADLTLEVETPHRPFFLRAASAHDLNRWTAALQRFAGLPVSPPWRSEFGPQPDVPESIISARAELGTLAAGVAPPKPPPGVSPPAVLNHTPRRASVSSPPEQQFKSGLAAAVSAAAAAHVSTPTPAVPTVTAPTASAPTASAPTAMTPTGMAPTASAPTAMAAKPKETVIFDADEDEPEPAIAVGRPTMAAARPARSSVTAVLEPVAQALAAAPVPAQQFKSVQSSIEAAMAARRASQVEAGSSRPPSASTSTAAPPQVKSKRASVGDDFDSEEGGIASGSSRRSAVPAITGSESKSGPPVSAPPPPVQVVPAPRGVVGNDRDWNEWDEEEDAKPPAPAPEVKSSRPPMPTGPAPTLPSGRTTLPRGGKTAAAPLAGIAADKNFVHDDWDA